MSQPFLSIVIPTRNRQHYCIAAIENILSYDYPDLELCVHDNSDDDHIQQYLQSRTPDPRLTYKRIAEQLNSVDNMDRAIGMATGHYVCMIGDDDTILPHIFEVTEWMDAHSIDSVCTNQRVQYYWPGAHPDDLSGLLRITTPPVQKMFDWPIEKKLDRLFHQGITRFKIYRLPQVYHGVILGRRLQEIGKGQDTISAACRQTSTRPWLSAASSNTILSLTRRLPLQAHAARARRHGT